MATNKKDAPKVPAKRDVLDREVAIRAHIDKTGLTVAGKSRALAAFDRLLGGAVGIPAAWLEGFRSRIETRNEIREQLIRADGRAAMARIEGMSEFGQLAIERLVREEIRKQENRTAVWLSAEEQLAIAPPTTHPDSFSEPSAGGTPEFDTEDQAIDDDWINVFTSYVDQASSDRLQMLWGRILAGEIRRPGSFSLTTLRLIAELDAEIAGAYEAVYRRAVGPFILRPNVLDGAVLDRFSFLQQVGLVQLETGLSLQVPVQFDGWGYLVGRNYLVRALFSPGSVLFQIPVIRITRVGLQIGRILQNDELDAIKEMARTMRPVTQLEVCRITARQANNVQWSLLETLPTGD